MFYLTLCAERSWPVKPSLTWCNAIWLADMILNHWIVRDRSQHHATLYDLTWSMHEKAAQSNKTLGVKTESSVDSNIFFLEYISWSIDKQNFLLWKAYIYKTWISPVTSQQEGVHIPWPKAFVFMNWLLINILSVLVLHSKCMSKVNYSWCKNVLLKKKRCDGWINTFSPLWKQ